MRTLLLAGTLLALTLAGCSSSPAPASTSSSSSSSPTTVMTTHAMNVDVAMRGNAFVNSTVTVHVGSTVKWTHQDGNTPHTVTADDNSFDSNPNCNPPVGVPAGGVCMTQGATFSHTFDKVGSVKYHCKIHSSMTGTITVAAMDGMANMTHG